MDRSKSEGGISASIPVPVAELLIKLVRLLARSGKINFREYLYRPLAEGGWKRDYSAETSPRILRRIEQMGNDPARVHSIAPHCKRMISQALTEGFSSVGNGVIFFLEMIARHRVVASARESQDFLKLIQGPLEKFEALSKDQAKEKFERNLEESSDQEIREAISPVPLGRQSGLVELQSEARILFEKIKSASSRDDITSCRKLISSYLIKYAEQEVNNRDEIEKLIDAFEKRQNGFHRELNDTIAINLYYQITRGIAESNLQQTIAGIKKYAFIFQGNPEISFHKDIDRLEADLYRILRKKGLMKDLIRQGQT